jgi:hypothetical protein
VARPVSGRDRLSQLSSAWLLGRRPPTRDRPPAGLREAVTQRNFAPGNIGAVLLFDVAAPALLIILYLVTD